MAYLAVAPGLQVNITSSVNAAALQRFQVLRQTQINTPFALLDIIQGNSGKSYEALPDSSTYEIRCEGAYGGSGWMPSREQVSLSPGGQRMEIRCEDYWSTDNDWNDLVVTATLGIQGPDLQIQRICTGSPVPAGWILVGAEWSPSQCGGGPVITKNVSIIRRFDQLSVGSEIDVCISNRVPPGWRELYRWVSSFGCGEVNMVDPSIPTMMRIRRIS